MVNKQNVKKISAIVVAVLVVCVVAVKTLKHSVTLQKIRSTEEIYKEECSVCHGSNLQGRIGPNLIDDFWIYGNTLKDVEDAIVKGIPDRPMPAYGDKLSYDQIKALVKLIQSKQGEKFDNPAPPQGHGGKLH